VAASPKRKNPTPTQTQKINIMKSIKQVIMERDGLTSPEAASLISEAREQFNEYVSNGDFDSAEEICADYFGLEPDYLVEFF